mmetsp:Transcript_35675/g.76066  ORF Transcript_35675/g.76066 Transcript_35675/m.76066 type:complete len:205 (-) Transcript_35675:1548-2162(-)
MSWATFSIELRDFKASELRSRVLSHKFAIGPAAEVRLSPPGLHDVLHLPDDEATGLVLAEGSKSLRVSANGVHHNELVFIDAMHERLAHRVAGNLVSGQSIDIFRNSPGQVRLLGIAAVLQHRLHHEVAEWMPQEHMALGQHLVNKRHGHLLRTVLEQALKHSALHLVLGSLNCVSSEGVDDELYLGGVHGGDELLKHVVAVGG